MGRDGGSIVHSLLSFPVLMPSFFFKIRVLQLGWNKTFISRCINGGFPHKNKIKSKNGGEKMVSAYKNDDMSQLWYKSVSEVSKW